MARQTRFIFSFVGMILVLLSVAAPSGVAPPPGPIIDLQLDATNGSASWTNQSGRSMKSSGYSGGSLRDDFLGTGVRAFRCENASGARSASHVRIEGPSYCLDIIKDSDYSPLRWIVRQHVWDASGAIVARCAGSAAQLAPRSNQSCSARGHVPEELLVRGAIITDLSESGVMICSKVSLQVETPYGDCEE